MDLNALFPVLQHAFVGQKAFKERILTVSPGFLRLFLASMQRMLLEYGDAGALNILDEEFLGDEILDVQNLRFKGFWGQVLNYMVALEKYFIGIGIISGCSARLSQLHKDQPKRVAFQDKCIRHYKGEAHNAPSTRALRFLVYKTLALIGIKIDYGYPPDAEYEPFMELNMVLFPELEKVAQLESIIKAHKIQTCSKIAKKFKMDPTDGYLPAKESMVKKSKVKKSMVKKSMVKKVKKVDNYRPYTKSAKRSYYSSGAVSCSSNIDNDINDNFCDSISDSNLTSATVLKAKTPKKMRFTGCYLKELNSSLPNMVEVKTEHEPVLDPEPEETVNAHGIIPCETYENIGEDSNSTSATILKAKTPKKMRFTGFYLKELNSSLPNMVEVKTDKHQEPVLHPEPEETVNAHGLIPYESYENIGEDFHMKFQKMREESKEFSRNFDGNVTPEIIQQILEAANMFLELCSVNIPEKANEDEMEICENAQGITDDADENACEDEIEIRKFLSRTNGKFDSTVFAIKENKMVKGGNKLFKQNSEKVKWEELLHRRVKIELHRLE